VTRHGYAADAPFIKTPRGAREHYRKRFGIESSYRLTRQSLALTRSRDAGFRLLLFVVSLLLQNVWRYLHWMCVAAPRREGCRFLEWSFVEFCNMVLCGAWTALRVRRAVSEPHARKPTFPVVAIGSGQRSWVVTPLRWWLIAANSDCLAVQLTVAGLLKASNPPQTHRFSTSWRRQ